MPKTTTVNDGYMDSQTPLLPHMHHSQIFFAASSTSLNKQKMHLPDNDKCSEIRNGGAQEIRTPHLFHAMEALYQMS